MTTYYEGIVNVFANMVKDINNVKVDLNNIDIVVYKIVYKFKAICPGWEYTIAVSRMNTHLSLYINVYL